MVPLRIALAEEGAGQEPQDVDGCDRRPDDAQYGQRQVGAEGSGEHHELRDEPAQTGESQRREAGDGEEEGGRAHALDQAVEDHAVADVGPLVNRSHHGEHQGRHYAVGEHLEHRAGQAHRDAAWRCP